MLRRGVVLSTLLQSLEPLILLWFRQLGLPHLHGRGDWHHRGTCVGDFVERNSRKCNVPFVPTPHLRMKRDGLE